MHQHSMSHSLNSLKGGYIGDTMVPNITPIMENQMEKKMENEMEAGIIGVSMS